MADPTACAHLKVLRVLKIEDGISVTRWQCIDCHAYFMPVEKETQPRKDVLKILAVARDVEIGDIAMDALHKKDVIVLRCDDPSGVRIVAHDPEIELLQGDIAWAAVESLGGLHDGIGESADANRGSFIYNLASRLKQRVFPQITVSK